jgi:hypothetical protein
MQRFNALSERARDGRDEKAGDGFFQRFLESFDGNETIRHAGI